MSAIIMAGGAYPPFEFFSRLPQASSRVSQNKSPAATPIPHLTIRNHSLFQFLGLSPCIERAAWSGAVVILRTTQGGPTEALLTFLLTGMGKFWWCSYARVTSIRHVISIIVTVMSRNKNIVELV